LFNDDAFNSLIPFNNCQWGVPKIHLVSVLASREGLTKIIEAYPDVDVTVGTIDEELKEGLVLPGLGDSGDRLFGTYQLDDDESLLHPSKRTKAEGADIPAGKRQRSESIAE
jgi:Uracil phosphoribosyltransferase